MAKFELWGFGEISMENEGHILRKRLTPWEKLN